MNESWAFSRAVLLVLPFLLLDVVLIAASLALLGLPYFWLMSEDKAPLVLRLWK